MYKLIIVENEEAECKRLKSLVDWKSMGVVVTGAYKNGKEALKCVKGQDADILLTESASSGNSGLELAMKVREIIPAIKVIFMGTSRQLEMIKQSAETEAYGYVLKPAKLPELYKTVGKMLGVAKHGEGQFSGHREESGADCGEKLQSTGMVISRLVSSLEICDAQGLDRHFECLFRQFEKSGMKVDSVKNTCLNLISRISLMLEEKNENYERIFGKDILLWDRLLHCSTLQDIRVWMDKIIHTVFQYLLRKKEGSSGKIIEDILRIVEEKYNKNLTVMDISREIYLTPNYISILFKKAMGESFTDYLVRYRLEKAKKFLQEPHCKVYQVGSMVGYNSISHFCSIFKEFYGVRPSEYRERA